MMKEAKGGAFATADMEILKRALHAYKDVLISQGEDNNRGVTELTKVENTTEWASRRR